MQIFTFLTEKIKYLKELYTKNDIKYSMSLLFW